MFYWSLLFPLSVVGAFSQEESNGHQQQHLCQRSFPGLIDYQKRDKRRYDPQFGAKVVPPLPPNVHTPTLPPSSLPNPVTIIDPPSFSLPSLSPLSYLAAEKYYSLSVPIVQFARQSTAYKPALYLPLEWLRREMLSYRGITLCYYYRDRDFRGFVPYADCSVHHGPLPTSARTTVLCVTHIDAYIQCCVYPCYRAIVASVRHRVVGVLRLARLPWHRGYYMRYLTYPRYLSCITVRILYGF